MTNPWFRMYTEAVDDEKLRLLAFEDRWHYVALLCCKGQGLLDSDCSPELMMRKLGVKLGLASRELDEVIRRLAEVDLVDPKTCQPYGWNDRQFVSDTSAERTRKWREKQKLKKNKRHRDVTVTVQDTDTEADTELELFPNGHNSLSSADDLEAEFEQWWKDEYPDREGGIGSKVKAKKLYINHRKKGVTKEQIWSATLKYFNQLVAQERISTQFVQQATRFLNEEPWVQ